MPIGFPARSTAALVLVLVTGCRDRSRAPEPQRQEPSPASSSSLPRASTSALDLHVTIMEDRWAVEAHGAPGTGECAGIASLAALKLCAQSLKRLSENDGGVVVTADPATRFARVLETLETLRGDAAELFPQFHFAPPKGVILPPRSPGGRSSPPTASPQSSARARPAVPGTELDPSEYAAIVLISKTQLTLMDDPEPLVTYESPLGADGLPATCKAGGQSDPYIVPLARALAQQRDLDVKIRSAKGLDASTSEIVIVADEATPYRALFEVVYTAGQAEFGVYHLLLRTRG